MFLNLDAHHVFNISCLAVAPSPCDPRADLSSLTASLFSHLSLSVQASKNLPGPAATDDTSHD
jgi:hypothetical protein